jgi:hypothetical protein
MKYLSTKPPAPAAHQQTPQSPAPAQRAESDGLSQGDGGASYTGIMRESKPTLEDSTEFDRASQAIREVSEERGKHKSSISKHQSQNLFTYEDSMFLLNNAELILDIAEEDQDAAWQATAKMVTIIHQISLSQILSH